MRVAIVFYHPYEGSYCNAILQSVTKGLQKANHEIDLIHLDKDNFDPVMRTKDLEAFVRVKCDGECIYERLDAQVLDYKQRLEQAEYLIFIFPIWWELMPAMTKGFIDKVIFPGVAYDYKPNGFMKKRWESIRDVTVITTMNTPGIIYRFVFGNAVKKAIFTGTFWKIGYKNRKWIRFDRVWILRTKLRQAFRFHCASDFGSNCATSLRAFGSFCASNFGSFCATSANPGVISVRFAPL